MHSRTVRASLELELQCLLNSGIAAVSTHGEGKVAMSFYQHDGTRDFRFQLIGEMNDEVAFELEQAWQTATSIMRGKELLLDVSQLTGVSASGRQLIERMQSCGAQLIVRGAASMPSLIRALGVGSLPPEENRRAHWLAFRGRWLGSASVRL